MPPHTASSHPLKIIPKELVFPAPLNRVITNILKLHNVSTSPLAYKVKTTAPQRYCVRPNNGVLPPGETIEVQVLLNYVKDAPPNLDTKDKFQIQSIVLAGPLANATDISEVWSKATPEQITKQKLKSRFTAATTKPAVTSTPPAPGTSTAPQDTSTIEPQATTTITTTQSQPSTTHDEVTPQSSNLYPNPALPQPAPQPTIQQTPQQTPQPTQPTQQTQQSTVEKKDSLGDSTEQHQFFTPTISSLPPSLKKDIPPPTNLEQKTLHESPPKIEARHVEFHDPPKPTGDYVVDSVATHSQLRKTLEQVAVLKSEREGVLKDNQKLNEQIKVLTEALQRAKEEQTGLRQRTTPHTSTPGGSHPSATQPLVASQPQQSVVQIQTQVLLFIIVIFSVIGFMLGRFF